MDIVFNTELARYEVYSGKSVVRAGALQPVYINSSYEKCEDYAKRVEERE